MGFPLFLFLLMLSAGECHALEAEWGLGVTGLGSWREVATPSHLNPGNAVVRIPRNSGLVEIKPDMKILTETWSFRARPRLRSVSDYVQTAAQVKSETKILLRWNEATLTGNFFDNLIISHGLQNFQWGPAESLAPSNLIFRESAQQKDLLYDTIGKHITRINFTPTQNLSEVFLFEWSDNAESQPYAEEGFFKKALLKSEFGWNGYANYAGLVLGWQEKTENWVGEYLNFELYPGLTFYVDANQKQGSSAWRPVRSNAGIMSFEQTEKESRKIFLTSVSGLRYAFESGSDLRAEWIFQEEGYRVGEFSNLNSGFSSSSIPQLVLSTQNFSRFYSNGIPFPSRSLGYFSYRIPDFLSWKDFSFYIRGLFSTRDFSNNQYLSFEKSVADHGTLLFSFLSSGGPADSELSGTLGKAVNIGYRHSW